MNPNDFGPIYKETRMDRLLVEPWNTFSNIVFFITLIYWGYRVYSDFHQHTFLAFCIPVLFIGFIGGTIYHATRSHQIWLAMDWMPIMILCLSVSVFYFLKIKINIFYLVFIVLLPFFIMFTVTRILKVSHQIYPLVGYSLIVIVILFPLFLYLIKTSWYNWQLIALAVIFFIIAIFFRTIDKDVNISFLPMGTHWLWHWFGGMSTFMLIAYIYHDKLLINN